MCKYAQNNNEDDEYIVGEDIGSSIGCNHNKQKYFSSMMKSKKIFLLDKRNEYKAVHNAIQPKNIIRKI